MHFNLTVFSFKYITNLTFDFSFVFYIKKFLSRVVVKGPTVDHISSKKLGRTLDRTSNNLFFETPAGISQIQAADTPKFANLGNPSKLL